MNRPHLPTVNRPPKHDALVGAAVYAVVGVAALIGATAGVAVLEVATRRWPSGSPTLESVVVTVPLTTRRWVVS